MKNSTQLAPVYFDQKKIKPSSRWDKVDANDIGEGFASLDGDFDFERRESEFIVEFSNKFVHGSSDFVFFTVIPRVKVKKKKKKVPINIRNKVTPEETRHFVKKVDRSITATSNFFMRELLPLSMSLNSAIDRVNEKTQQLTQEKAELPADFIRSRASAAISLRILRFLTEQFGLTKEEAELLRLGKV